MPIAAISKSGNAGIHIMHLLSPLPDIYRKVVKSDLFAAIYEQRKNGVAAIQAINVSHKDIRNDQHNSDHNQSTQRITPKKDKL